MNSRWITPPESLCEHLLESLHVPVFVVAPDGHVRWLNDAACTFLGNRIEDAMGAPFGDVLGIDKTTADIVLPLSGVPAGAEWQDFMVRLAGWASRTFRIRRTTVPDPDRGFLALLTIEGTAWWEEPDMGLLTGSRFLIFEAYPDGRVLRGAAPLEVALGLPPRALAGGSLMDRIPADARDLFDRSWSRALAGDVVREMECTLMGDQGRRRPFSLSLVPVRDIRGNVIGVRGAASDLELQKDLAYALESAEERFSVVFRDSSDPILILSAEGEILSANETFEAFTGVDSKSLFRGEKSWEDFVVADDLPTLKACLASGLEPSGESVCEFRMMNRDGEPIWFEQRLSLLHDERDQAKGFLAVARNIHHRKQVELELRQEARAMQERHVRAQALISRIKRFFTSTSELPGNLSGFLNGICEILEDMYQPTMVCIHLMETDQTYLRYHGRAGEGRALGTAERPAGLPSRMCDLVMRTGSPYLNVRLDKDPEFKDDALVKEYGLRTYLGAALRDAAGVLRGSIALFDSEPRPLDSLDVELITVASFQVAARLRAEEQEETRVELESHLRQAQKMEALGMLAGGVAHDFNNILSGILGFSSYLLSQSEPGTSLHRDLGLIELSAERASDLTRQLLAFARRKHFPKSPVPLNRIVNETVSILRRTLDKKIRIEVDGAPDLADVLGDAGQLSQVVMNLCLNAAEAMAGEGGTLTVATRFGPMEDRERSVLAQRGKEPEDVIRLSVKDTGIGMSPEVRDHIFDPFFTTKSKQGGTGLGLSIVYGIVTNHGGDVRVTSAPGEGTLFEAFLPAGVGDAADLAPVVPGDLHGSETVLVVDDELIVRQMVTEVLSGYGYQVVGAASGTEAVQMYPEIQGRIDVVLLDMVMPGLSGEETFTELRRMDPELSVLLTSGYAQEDVTDRLIGQGAVGMVYKPYKSETLLAHIRRTLDPQKSSPST